MHPAPNLTCFICSTRYSQAILEQNPRGLQAINRVMHRALFILIWTQINAISRELKFWHLISRKKWTLSLKFRSTLILKFISPKKPSCQISKACKLTCLAFCLGLLNLPSCSSSHRGSFLRFKRSYQKNFHIKERRKSPANFTESLRSMRLKTKPPARREVFVFCGLFCWWMWFASCIISELRWRMTFWLMPESESVWNLHIFEPSTAS